MIQVETHIKNTAPGSLYGEWAKKEDCWEDVKRQSYAIDLKSIEDDLINKKNPPQRRKVSEDDVELLQIEADNELLKSIPLKVWTNIEEWGKATNKLTDFQQTITWNLAHTKANSKITDTERNGGLKILDIVRAEAPEILFEIDEMEAHAVNDNESSTMLITLELVKALVAWDKKHKRLKDHEYILMAELAEGKKELSLKYKKSVEWSVIKAKKYGFKE